MKLMRSNFRGPYTRLDQFEEDMLKANPEGTKKVDNVKYSQFIDFTQIKYIKKQPGFVKDFLEMKKQNEDATKEELEAMVNEHAETVLQEIKLNEYLQQYIRAGDPNIVVVFTKKSGEKYIITYEEITPDDLSPEERAKYDEIISSSKEPKEVMKL